MSSKILFIVPAYNEEKSIKQTVKSILTTGYDYIVINDGSTDSTAKILEQNNYNHINLLSNLGIGGAVQTGYKYALPEYMNELVLRGGLEFLTYNYDDAAWDEYVAANPLVY